MRDIVHRECPHCHRFSAFVNGRCRHCCHTPKRFQDHGAAWLKAALVCFLILALVRVIYW